MTKMDANFRVIATGLLDERQSFMANVADVCRLLDDLAPSSLAESWDNVGLLIGRTDREVRKLMTCLTLTLPVAHEAIDGDVQMIVTHHPILFRGVKKITDATEEGRLILALAESGVAVYSPHTAFDSAAEGINHWLATELGLRDVRPLRPSGDSSGNGAGRYGFLNKPMEKEAFLRRICEITGAERLEYCWNETSSVQRVGVACGSAAEFLPDAIRAGCDTFLTGEARFHAVLESQARFINLILSGHFHSERPAVEWLANRIAGSIPQIVAFASFADKNPLRLFVMSSD